MVEVILQLTDEGDEILNSGSHEYRVYCAIPESGIPQSDILVCYWSQIYNLIENVSRC